MSDKRAKAETRSETEKRVCHKLLDDLGVEAVVMLTWRAGESVVHVSSVVHSSCTCALSDVYRGLADGLRHAAAELDETAANHKQGGMH